MSDGDTSAAVLLSFSSGFAFLGFRQRREHIRFLCVFCSHIVRQTFISQVFTHPA